jgi:hypothetical protein
VRNLQGFSVCLLKIRAIKIWGDDSTFWHKENDLNKTK